MVLATFLDSDNDPSTQPQGPPLPTFRNTTIKSTWDRSQSAWNATFDFLRTLVEDYFQLQLKTAKQQLQ